jgi:hypothetical protein
MARKEEFGYRNDEGLPNLLEQSEDDPTLKDPLRKKKEAISKEPDALQRLLSKEESEEEGDDEKYDNNNNFIEKKQEELNEVDKAPTDGRDEKIEAQNESELSEKENGTEPLPKSQSLTPAKRDRNARRYFRMRESHGKRGRKPKFKNKK